MPKHDSANTTIAKIRPKLGASLIMGRRSPGGVGAVLALGRRPSSCVSTSSGGFAVTICSSE